ncbi:MAG TPA: TIR domain-containing protein [Alphaproteobacteria bacterium]|nr:TIR domain-containing protein [Alphaproteobacteria bacterium]
MAHDLFISYSTQDKPTADAACATLEAAGIRCWIAPRDIVPGAEWGEAIVSAIADCRAMILIFSASANDSPQIRREVERAVSKGIPVIPLRIEDIAPTRSLEYFIGTVHWLDALTPPLENHLRRLADTVKALLQVPPAAPGVAEKLSAPAIAAPAPARRPVPAWLPAGAAALLVLAVLAAGWWFYSAKAPAPETARAPPLPSVAIAVQSETPPPKSTAAQSPAAAGSAASPAPPAPSAAAVPSEASPAKTGESTLPAAAGEKASAPPPKSPEAESVAAASSAASPAPAAPSVAAVPSEPPPAKTGESTLPAAAGEQALAPPPAEADFVRVPAQVARAPASGGAGSPPPTQAASAGVPAPAAQPPASGGVPATRRFDNPMVEGMALDYCRLLERDCGKPAADAFCQSQGFAASIDFTPQFHAPPTRVIASGQVCDKPICARMVAITCGAASGGASAPPPVQAASAGVPAQAAQPPASGGVPATRHFDNPLVEGVALDFCRTWARDCGKPAADAFCQSQGFAAAIDFTRQPHAPPTRVIGSGQVCNGANCARIDAVTCGAASASASSPPPSAQAAPAGGATPPGATRQATLEYGVNRRGSDMRSLELPGGTPEQCRNACLADMSCLAFTFVQPGIQGPNARCWLKNAVPQATPSTCCVSGVAQ